MNSKVDPAHLERKAYVYVRQSTQYQVANHQQSQHRQYGFADQAVELGWPREQLVVVDEDQGKSGACANSREGFGRLVTAVGMGEVGIVLSLEASRLARNSADWHNLIYMSRYTNTLIADEHGVYDPSDPTDRMVLGLRGQMSELELETSIHRMMEGRKHKAERGEFLVYPPAGYEVDDLYQIVLSDDESVRNAIEAVFKKFFELGSVTQVCKWWCDQGLKFPVRRTELRSRPVKWVAPIYRHFLYVLHHPLYAGAYVFGRSRTVRELSPEEPRRLQVRRVRVPREDWAVLIRDHHPAYISWQEYETIQERIEQNRQMMSKDSDSQRGPAREGRALLQGMVRCGHCGRSMYVSYGGTRNTAKTRRTLQYRCSALRVRHGAPDCQTVGGQQINDVVVEVFLQATRQAGVEAARLAVEEVQHEQASAERLWEMQIEKAEYEAQRAARQYHAVEPENRLVARTLETNWNAALRKVEELKEQAQRRRREHRPLSELEVARVRKLSEDLERVWHAETTSNQDRKRLLRAAIEEVQLMSEEQRYLVKIIWKGGATTERQLRRRRRGDANSSATSKDTVEMVRLLATEFDDAQIATVLAKQGRRTGRGNPFSAQKVAQLRNRNDIPVHPRHKPRSQREGPFTADQAAAELNVSGCTIQRWLKAGILPGTQLAPGAPWKIVLTEELRKKLSGDEAPEGWVGLTEAARRLGLSKQRVAYLVKTGKLEAVRVKVGTRSYWKINVEATSYRRQGELVLPMCDAVREEA